MKVGIDHLTLNVDSPDVCVQFYSNVLGLPPENYEEWKEGKAKFPSVRLNANNMIHFFPPDMWEELGDLICTPGKANHVCIAYDGKEWKKLLERLNAHKITPRGPFNLMGARGKGTSIFVDDPEGFTIELKGYDEE